MYQHTSKTKHNGFTLVETLVAISVLLLVIIGPMTIAQKGIQNAYFANEQIVAVFLAQEAIEGVRELRDKNGLEANDNFETGQPPGYSTWADWMSSLPTGNCASGDECGFDRSESINAGNPIFRCSDNGSVGCSIRKNLGSNLYTHDAGDATTIFTREIILGPDLGDMLSVTVEVTWSSNLLGNRRVKLQTWLYNHYRYFEL